MTFRAPAVRRGSCLLPALLLLMTAVHGAAAQADSTALRVDRWLVLGPAPLVLPLDEAGAATPAAAVLDLPPVAVRGLWPGAGDRLRWPDGSVLTWTAAQGERARAGGAAGNAGGVTYAATFVEARRYVVARLTAESAGALRVFVDGSAVLTLAAGASEGSDEVRLAPGRHVIVAVSVQAPAMADSAIGVALTLRHAAGADALAVTDDPVRPVRIADLLDTEAVTSLAVSPDGERVAVQMRQPEVPAPNAESWIDVRSMRDGSVVRTFRGNSPVSAFTWSPRGGFSYVTTRDGRSTLWVGEWNGGARPLLTDVERLGVHRWLPDASAIIYALTTEAPRDERGLRRMQGVQDRWAGWRNRSHLYQVQLDGGAVRRLTAGTETTALQDISPDSRRVLYTRTRFTTEWPFSANELHELDLATLSARQLTRYGWGGSASYGPDGERILLVGGPTMFGAVGVNVPEGVTPNEYDPQAYIMDRRTGQVTAITRDFDPAIDQAVWSRADGMIYLRVQERDQTQLYRYDPAQRSMTRMNTGVEAVAGMSLAADAPRLAFTGTSANSPPRVYALDLNADARPRLLHFPGRAVYERVALSRVEDFDFTTEDGTTIQGRLHLPPDFDATRRYPLIVNYYGGTIPVGRTFGGRYPPDLWAGLGYIVYIPQPSGAIGWGQVFSARHVNDWGVTVADEIIRGTERLLAEKPYIDRERVGCIGASYGGFMTMLLTTRTDLFAGCVSHAGISGLASYWGEGWWGYAYSAIATAHSYPWNRPDLYVDQSPLFRADRIRTPLLLLHGTADTNVPPGESEQLYTALTLLGREVEYVRIEGEDHQILQYPKRQAWMETIVAWFDRTLKRDRAWWDALYPR